MTQRFANSDFSRYVAAARLFPMPTIKAATEAARALGVMIRREAADMAGDCRGFEVYPMGASDGAMWAECPAEALFLAEAMAADLAANRLAFSGQPSIRALAEVMAARAAAAIGIEAEAMAPTVETGQPPVIHFAGGYSCPMRPGESYAENATRVAACAEAAAEEREAAEAAEAAAPAGSVGAMRNPAAPAPAPRIKRAKGAHGVTLAAPCAAEELAATGQGGAFPLWATGAERRPAAALLRDIAESHAAAALFN